MVERENTMVRPKVLNFRNLKFRKNVATRPTSIKAIKNGQQLVRNPGQYDYLISYRY